MTTFIDSIRAEYLRYKTLAEAAIDQLPDDALSAEGPDGGNSIAVICWHISGNLRSRFTDFLTSNGEKPWRNRDEEFEARTVSREALLAKWNLGWNALLGALANLSDEQLQQSCDDSKSAPAGSGSASSLARAPRLPRWPDCVHRQIDARKGLDLFEHCTRHVERVQRGDEIQTRMTATRHVPSL